MNPPTTPGRRCGLDTVEIARLERLLRDTPAEHLCGLFTPQELQDAGTGPGRAASLAARFAAKEACCKLFPRETALGAVTPADFSVERDAYGAPRVRLSAGAQTALDLHRLQELHVSLTHSETSATAIAWADPRLLHVPWFGRLIYLLFPYRRGVTLENLRRVFGEVLPEPEIRRLAEAYYAHYLRFLHEFIRLPFMSARRRREWIRIENVEAPLRAHREGKGLILLTGHFGNFEVATVAGISQFPEYRGKLHFVRRALKPQLLNHFINWRFRHAGFGVLPKRGSLDRILALLADNALIVYPFDQHAGKRDGVVVDFFGHPAGTFKSVALLALTTGASVVPACSWREEDGSHVLRFEDPLPLIQCDDVGQAIQENTRTYNAAIERMLLRHPEQWIWMHQRWKSSSITPSVTTAF
jgi:phosphopantetheine--protein transferase-like protein